jgi:peptide/nickel transport system substrate-binding protein
LRDEWLADGPAADQTRLTRRIQQQFWQDLPVIPLGEYYLDSAWRRNLVGIRKGMALPINVRRA